MHLHHPALDRLLARDLLAEALALMKPGELAVAALRADGLTPAQIAELLGIDPTTVYRRLHNAQARIIHDLPELRPFLQDRAHPRCTDDPAPVSSAREGTLPPLTTAQAARRLGITPLTVRTWCAEGRFPHAYKTPTNHWRIPQRDL
jgi:excisionase family DNA binding protein